YSLPVLPVIILIVCQSLSVRQILLPRNISRVSILHTYLPFLHQLLHHSSACHTVALAQRLHYSTTIAVCSCIGWIHKNPIHSACCGLNPDSFVSPGAEEVSHRDF